MAKTKTKTKQEYFCPIDTTERILEKHGVTYEDALVCLVNALWVDHKWFEDALRDKRRYRERTDPRTPPAPIDTVCGNERPAIVQVARTLQELLTDHGMFEIVGEKKGKPINADGEVDQDSVNMEAMIELLDAAIADAKRQFASA
jgi:hypothetical protein